MDAATVKEARRLLTELVLYGKATLFGGRKVEPRDDILIAVFEKIAAKKLEEAEIAVSVTDFVPRSTYHEKSKDSDAQSE